MANKSHMPFLGKTVPTLFAHVVEAQAFWQNDEQGVTGVFTPGITEVGAGQPMDSIRWEAAKER